MLSKSSSKIFRTTTTILNTNICKKYGSKNGQLFDLGLDPKVNNTSMIQKKIKTLHKEFDLVLITEYFDESLILLKRFLCWSYDDILYISAGVRSKSHRYSVSEDLQKKIREWNAGDVLLYNHFNKTLWRKIDEYGSAFQTDLEEFKMLEKEAYSKCVDKNKSDQRDRRVDTANINKENSGKYCQDLLRDDVTYTTLLKRNWEIICNQTLNKAVSEKLLKRSSEMTTQSDKKVQTLDQKRAKRLVRN